MWSADSIHCLKISELNKWILPRSPPVFFYISCLPSDTMRSPLWTVSFLFKQSLQWLAHQGPWTILLHCEGEHGDCNPCRMTSAPGGSPKPWYAMPAMRCPSKREGALGLPSDNPSWKLMKLYRLHLIAPRLSWKSPQCRRETKAPSCNQVPKAGQSDLEIAQYHSHNCNDSMFLIWTSVGVRRLLGSCWDLFGKVLDCCGVSLRSSQATSLELQELQDPHHCNSHSKIGKLIASGWDSTWSTRIYTDLHGSTRIHTAQSWMHDARPIQESKVVKKERTRH